MIGGKTIVRIERFATFKNCTPAQLRRPRSWIKSEGARNRPVPWRLSLLWQAASA